MHSKDGMQLVSVAGDVATTQDPDSSCLGADCTTGVWIILGMVDSGVPGVYVVFAAEESGCVGSRAMANDPPPWLVCPVSGEALIQACISFDRMGQESIITHQCGMRTSSDTFAVSLSQVLGMSCLRPDPTGVFTDSESFAHIIPECTNVSVGYLAQHTNAESQDLYFADQLLESLINADWGAILIGRDPAESFYPDFYLEDDLIPNKGRKATRNIDELELLVRDYPEAIAEMLDSYGITPYDVLQELGIDTNLRGLV